MDFPKIVEAKTVDHKQTVKGALLYDLDQDCWRVVESFFEVEAPRLEEEVGIFCHEVDVDTVIVIQS